MLTRLSWMTAILLLGSGCSMLESGARTLFTEPCEYAGCVDDCTARLNHQIRASHVWAEIQQGTPGQPFSEDYANGFKEGYADYLYAGGTGQPPPLPPRKYWATRYATWEGRQAVQDWFAGFRHGAMLAQETGYRQYATVPSSLPAGGAACSYSQPASPAAAPDHPPLPEPTADPPPPEPAADRPPPEIVPAPTEPANSPAGMELQPAGDGPSPLVPADVPSPSASTYELEAAPRGASLRTLRRIGPSWRQQGGGPPRPSPGL